MPALAADVVLEDEVVLGYNMLLSGRTEVSTDIVEVVFDVVSVDVEFV